jgi:hypothetical protein
MGNAGRWILGALFCFVFVLIAGPTIWWWPLPFLGLGILLFIPIFGILLLLSPFLVVAAILKAVFGRNVSRDKTVAVPPPAKRSPGQRRPSPGTTRGTGEWGKLMAEAEAKVDAMRTFARRMPKPATRAHALEICAIADRVLTVLQESRDERLARDVVTRYLTPAETIFTRYARLATREVAAAGPALTRVEEEDLPLIERKLSDLYDRLHRGDLIDLEVAREMLAFDFAAANSSMARS